MGTQLRIALRGDEAELGRVPAGDVARMLIGVERAVARAAGHVMGRQVKATGRRGRTIEETTRFRLVGIESGSVVGVLELPDERLEDEVFELDDQSLGELALDSALQTAAGERTDQLDVAEAFVRLADDLGVGTRYSEVIFEETAVAAPHPRVKLDRASRDRLAEVIAAGPDARQDSLIGVLVEADFERNTARLRTSSDRRIAVSFESEFADQIQEGLRRQAELSGEVEYDPKTLEARSVKLRSIIEPEQLTVGLEAGDFWSSRPVAELAREQGVRPITDVEQLRDHEISEEEVDRLLAVLAEM
jgi:hypothetical protein